MSNEEELRRAVEQGGYIQLTDDIVISQVIEIKKDLVIDGKKPDSGSANGENCYTVSTSVADRVFNVNQAEDLSLVFQNLQILSESEEAYTRGISLYQSKNIQVELENVKLTAGYYALNIASENKGITAELDHSLLEGWCAFQLWSPSKVSVKNSILNGNNNKSYNQDGWNDFSTIVINQDATESEVTVENSTITASTGTGNC